MLLELANVFAVIWDDYIAANHLENDTDFFRYELVDVLLTSVGIDQGFAFDRQIEEYYYEPWQMGDPEAMVYGSVDVSGLFAEKQGFYFAGFEKNHIFQAFKVAGIRSQKLTFYLYFSSHFVS